MLLTVTGRVAVVTTVAPPPCPAPPPVLGVSATLAPGDFTKGSVLETCGEGSEFTRVGFDVERAAKSCELEGGVVVMAVAKEVEAGTVCDTLAVADAMLFSTTLLATATALPGVELRAGLGPPNSLVSDRVLPLTMSERVLGPSSVEVWL